MRAMVLDNPKPAEQAPLTLRELPDPAPAAGEVRIRVRACGLCHTDLHTVEGDLPLPKLPVIPGHQIVGIVDAAGPQVRHLRAGDRVGIPWLFSTDQTCAYCRSGNENLCDHARFTGYHVNGGYADAVIVAEDYAYPIPAAFTDLNAAPLLCAGIIGYRSWRKCGVRRGDRLGLYGFGASAHIVIQLARYGGQEVSVFTRAPAHQELASRLGASWVGRAEDKPPGELDAAILFAPAGALVPLALAAVRKAGRVVLAGITMSPIPQMDYSLLYQERSLLSVANSTRRDARELLELAAAIPVHTEVQSFDLAQANQALAALKHSRIEGAGVLRIST